LKGQVQELAKILVCDDSAFMRMMLKRVLVDGGHEVVGEAGDGMQAVQLFRQLKPDITTMDITMPKLNGVEAVKLIYKEDPIARVVMVTAIGQQAIINEALEAGASDFLLKPFENAAVLSTIEKLIK
jgi:two-component system, chemotaxis family, chemotaxis protein CheY